MHIGDIMMRFFKVSSPIVSGVNSLLMRWPSDVSLAVPKCFGVLYLYHITKIERFAQKAVCTWKGGGGIMEASDKARIHKSSEYYDLHVQKVRQRTETREYQYLLDRFMALLPSDSCIIDIGCGTGEHLAYFQHKSYPAVGIEPSVEMRRHCRERGLEVLDGSFEKILEAIEPINQPIGGIWCAASMLHVPAERFEPILNDLNRILQDRGVLFFTVRLGIGSYWDKFDNENSQGVERFIQFYEEAYLDGAIHRIGFERKLKLVEESYWGRRTDWISYLLVKS
jgi:SAM-dependent methyltransferase